MRKKAKHNVARDALLSFAILVGAIALSALLSRYYDDNNPFAMPVFILAVALVARYTEGYVYGIAVSAAGVFSVNYMFTYPFFEFDMSIAGYPLNFAAMLFVSVTISMLTTRIRRQEQLRFEVEREKIRSDLLRSVSHDIRTPLTSILGASSALMENPDMPRGDRDELVREINKDARWLVRITENILSVTKFTGSDSMLKKDDEIAEELVISAIAKFRKDSETLPISIIKPEEIFFVPADATLIEQVLLNLFRNAVMHGGRTTLIRVGIEREGEDVAFTVEDDGVGFADDALPHIFDGTSGESGRDRHDGRPGMGIGLAVCRSIIRAHGGEISAFNNSMGGASVRFRLPGDF